MDIKISKAKKEDFPYIKEKIGEYLLDATNINWRQFFVVRSKDRPVAFGRIIDHEDFFEIASLGVDYHHRRKGIGREILYFLVQKARKRDGQKPIFGVTHLKPFLTSCGFVQIKDGYPDYLDYKRKHICHLSESKISIVKWQDR